MSGQGVHIHVIMDVDLTWFGALRLIDKVGAWCDTECTGGRVGYCVYVCLGVRIFSVSGIGSVYLPSSVLLAFSTAHKHTRNSETFDMW